MQHDPRRTSPRIGTEALCWEMYGNHEVSSLIVDLSTEGARLERPYAPENRYANIADLADSGPLELGPAGRSDLVPLSYRKSSREVPLQIEVPEIDEVMWATAEVVFDKLVQAPPNTGGAFGLMRRTGYRIALAAQRDMRLIRDYVWHVHETALERAHEERMRSGLGFDWARAF